MFSNLKKINKLKKLTCININSILFTTSSINYNNDIHISKVKKKSSRIKSIDDALDIKEFIASQNVKNGSNIYKNQIDLVNKVSKLADENLTFFIETYGCQMNVGDSEIIRSILLSSGLTAATDVHEADLILTNTCAIRENAEAKVWHRLKYFQSIRANNRIILNKSQLLNNNDPKRKKKLYPMVGVLGCMAERLKEKLLDDEGVDFVVGPDGYREIPSIITRVFNSTDQKEANTQLSFEETYADIKPVRESSTYSAFVSIMRGCNNMCSFCIVPFTRGRERSRPFATILEEVKQAYDNGCREIVLLGQNVNGYHDTSKESALLYPNSSYKIANEQGGGGFKNLYNSRDRQLPGPRFVDLLEAVSNISPELRIRFTSPHPKDFPDEVFHLIKEKKNICNSFHLPLQSGSTNNLSRMRRGYSKEAFIELADRLKEIIPNVSISTDIIAGFCGETEQEHQDTIDVMKRVNFDQAFMFAYSLREKTHAHRSNEMNDDVSEEIKLRRLQEIIDVHRNSVFIKNRREELGQLRLVLVEGYSTKSTENDPFLTGRTDGNKRVVFKGNSILSNGYLIDPNTGNLWKSNSNSNSNNSLTNELIEILNEIDNNLKLPEINTPSDAEFATNLHKKYETSIINSLAKISNDHKINHNQLPGKYVVVKITKANGPTLLGVGLAVSSITEFEK